MLVFCCLSIFATSQKKYQGLLWEISGNGMSEPSYLYGTMHVSNKLAFNVSDSFYICLNKVKAVALESSPEFWMDDYRKMGMLSNYGGYQYYLGLYNSAFKIARPKKAEIYDLLENRNGLMNQILYRFNPGSEDYQENTYLDMFIFQAGAKNGKPIYSLEELEEVFLLSVLAMKPDKDKKRDNEKNQYLDNSNNDYRKYELLEEAYRLGDLDKIDSLSKAGNRTESYHKYFIVERNKNMVNRLDSLMKIHSIFTGIGAAHLPGDEGAIELLREKGYTVRPVSTKSTGKAHKMRKKLTELYKTILFTPTTTEDKFLTVSVPGKLFEMPSNLRGRMEYLAPEPINGGYFSIIRLFTFGPLFNKSAEFFKQSFDSLVYIATPGEIIKKADISINGYSGYEIKSKTSKNSIVEYKVLFTPTEIVIFKGTGNGEYIERPEPQAFFSKINLAPLSSTWNEVSPKFGGAKWKMKGTVTCQDMIEDMDVNVDPLYQSYDQSTGDYFMVMRHIYNDIQYIEEDSFDLAYMGEIFAKDIGYEISSTYLGRENGLLFVEQELSKDKKHPELRDNVSIKTIAKGGVYYFMLSTGSKDSKRIFFDSFKFTDYTFEYKFETYIDSALSYSAETILDDDSFDFEKMSREMYESDDEELEDKTYAYHKESFVHSCKKSGETIYVEFKKFNDYDGADSVEQFWKYQIQILLEGNPLKVSSKKNFENGNDIGLSFTLTDTNSTRGIFTKLWLHQGVLYTVQSLIDTVSGPSIYVSTFFNTFQPLDTMIGRTLFEDKAALFFEHIVSEDSTTKANAFKSIDKIDFTTTNVEQLINFYNEFSYDEKKQTEQREKIILSFHDIEDARVYKFLADIYTNNNFDANLQFAVLNCLSRTETQESTDLLKKLLIENTAFTQNKTKLNFFESMYDSLELTKSMFLEILDLTSYPEYKTKIIALLATGYADSILTVKHFISEKKSIIRDANVEMKRTLSDQEKDGEEANKYTSYSNYSSYSSNYGAYKNILLDYYILMCALKKESDPGIPLFFEGIQRVKDKKFILEAEIIHKHLGMPVDTSKINKVIKDREFAVWAYNRLKREEMLGYYNPIVSQQDFAFSYLYSSGFNPKEDSVVFLEKIFVNNGKDTGYVYFFKRKSENLKNWMVDYVGVLPVDSSEYTSYNLLTKKGLSVKTDEATQETIEKTMETFILRNRKRVSKASSNGWFGYDNMFQDY